MKSTALPARFYGDPAEVVDELREARVIELRKKRRRIKAASETVWCSPACVPEVGKQMDLLGACDAN